MSEISVDRKITLSRGTVDIKVSETNKEVKITITGQYSKEVLDEFFEMYEKKTKSLNRSQYDLVIDCKLLGVFQAPLLPIVSEAYKRYRDFKSVTFINPDHPVGKMQLTRLAKKDGHMDFFKFINR